MSTLYYPDGRAEFGTNSFPFLPSPAWSGLAGSAGSAGSVPIAGRIGQLAGPHTVLQSRDWDRVQTALGRRTHRFRGPGWSALVIEESNTLGRIWYLPYGPVANDVVALEVALTSLGEAAKKARVAWVRIEPMVSDGSEQMRAPGLRSELLELGAREAPRDIQPRRSRWLDLTQGEDAILAAMTGTNRNLWRRHQDKGLSIECSRDPGDVEELISLNRAGAERKGFVAHDADYLRTVARTLLTRDSGRVYLTRYEGQVVASAFVYDSASTRIFAHAGMKPEFRKLRPNQPMIAQAVLDAAERGAKIADLFGIAPTDSPHHPWAGFTQFKRSFGGRDVEFAGTWDLPVSVPRYAAYRSMRSGRGMAQGMAGALRGRLRG